MANSKDNIINSLVQVEENLPESSIRYFKDIKETDKPLIPLPPDHMADITYPQFIEVRCAICSSHLRNIAEHVYLESGKKPQAVIKFFEKHFGARLNWTQVSTHMDSHCDFKKLVTSGLKSYEHQEELIAPWIFRENQLALTALMVELDDVRGIDCSKNNDLKLKRAAMVEKLISKILDIKDKRDNQGVFSINVFEILSELHDKFESEHDKRLLRDELKKLREKLKQEN
jgi:hypothetical protein